MRGGLALLAAATLAGGCANGAPLAGHTGPASPARAAGAARAGTAGATAAPSAAGTGGGTAAPSAAGTADPADPLAGRRLITVTAASTGATYATLTAYRRAAGRRRVFGPWTARVGRNGFAAPGRKREGDGRTPSGTYGFGFFFGVQPDPGVAYPYRRRSPTTTGTTIRPARATTNGSTGGWPIPGSTRSRWTSPATTTAR